MHKMTTFNSAYNTTAYEGSDNMLHKINKELELLSINSNINSSKVYPSIDCLVGREDAAHIPAFSHPVCFKEKVVIGPRLSIITGDHKMNAVGKYMADVTDEEKDEENDQDVIIEKDVWIGANVTILKGVTVAEGCVIGAGTVLTKSTHPYGIYVGVPGRRVSERFTNEELENHINILQEKSKW